VPYLTSFQVQLLLFTAITAFSGFLLTNAFMYAREPFDTPTSIEINGLRTCNIGSPARTTQTLCSEERWVWQPSFKSLPMMSQQDNDSALVQSESVQLDLKYQLTLTQTLVQVYYFFLSPTTLMVKLSYSLKTFRTTSLKNTNN